MTTADLVRFRSLCLMCWSGPALVTGAEAHFASLFARMRPGAGDNSNTCVAMCSVLLPCFRWSFEQMCSTGFGLMKQPPSPACADHLVRSCHRFVTLDQFLVAMREAACAYPRELLSQVCVRSR